MPAPGDCKKTQDPVSQLVRRSSNALLELKTRLKVAQAGAPTGTAKGGAATGGTSRGSGCTAKGGTDRVGTMISGAAKGSASKITAAPGAKENSAKKKPPAPPGTISLAGRSRPSKQPAEQERAKETAVRKRLLKAAYRPNDGLWQQFIRLTARPGVCDQEGRGEEEGGGGARGREGARGAARATCQGMGGARRRV